MRLHLSKASHLLFWPVITGHILQRGTQDVGIAPRTIEGSQKRCFSSVPLLSAFLEAPKAVGQAQPVMRPPGLRREREESRKVNANLCSDVATIRR
ncbi:hypothetical protein BU25DRAFT_212480 [Macroventuria anomochaeta]|uniref:Uncharacterized protein n=1 Tax=Macroventuria anomochaeta TaxID=301207 RepID=A0ACB6RMT7_9PLEO|nr:uncharacterized protein BU25DRAFT_212480 [Macroventuria anomochaeta]KAF2622418.1 hypothetical protein BU25DRAFT_212480 [Macroventuria anomochaeta]